MYYPDRFILDRNKFNIDSSNFKIQESTKIIDDYQHSLRSVLLDPFKSVLPFNNLKNEYVKDSKREYNKAPISILDALGYENDFYLNLLDWSFQDIICVALSEIIYAIHLAPIRNEIITETHSKVTAIRWNCDGTLLAFGNIKGEIYITDFETRKIVFYKKIGNNRITSISWNMNIMSISMNDTIVILDTNNRKTMTIREHECKVCITEWNLDKTLLASGCNDNIVRIWDIRKMPGPIYSIHDHDAAIKAIAWSPLQNNVLATGGGTNDRKLIITNILNENKQVINTNSQISSLAWSEKHPQEIISSHGYCENTIKIWDINKKKNMLEKFNSFHNTRILKMCQSPKTGNVASISPDDLLVIWSFFNHKKKTKKSIKLAIR